MTNALVMDFEYSYMLVVVMLVVIAVFYFSPYELRVSEEDNE
ncbi:hypothetical protein [Mucilaginibacter sp.]